MTSPEYDRIKEIKKQISSEYRHHAYWRNVAQIQIPWLLQRREELEAENVELRGRLSLIEDDAALIAAKIAMTGGLMIADLKAENKALMQTNESQRQTQEVILKKATKFEFALERAKDSLYRFASFFIEGKTTWISIESKQAITDIHSILHQ